MGRHNDVLLVFELFHVFAIVKPHFQLGDHLTKASFIFKSELEGTSRKVL